MRRKMPAVLTLEVEDKVVLLLESGIATTEDMETEGPASCVTVKFCVMVIYEVAGVKVMFPATVMYEICVTVLTGAVPLPQIPESKLVAAQRFDAYASARTHCCSKWGKGAGC